MGDAQSAQREGKKDAAAEEAESGKVDDAQTEQHTEEKPLKNKGQISEINGKADSSIAEVNGYCEDEIAAQAILSLDEVKETQEPLKGAETPLENVNISESESPNEAEPNEEVTMEMTDIEAKQNDINEGFRKFFSNIGFKFTVKRGSGEKTEIATEVPVETNAEEPTADVEDSDAKAKSENADQNTDVNIAPETCDNDSTCATLTYVTCCDVQENAEEKTTETKEEVTSETADTVTTSPDSEEEKTNQDATPEEEQHPTTPPSPDQEVVVSPIKRFFTTGIFSGLRKKKKSVEEETTEKELVDLRKKEATQDKEISPSVQAAAVETEHKENEVNAPEVGENKHEGKLSPTDSLTVIVSEPEILSSQEKDRIQASPLKRLLSGSNLKKLPKKQRSRTSSDAKLSDSGEHLSDQVLSSTESAEHQKEESPGQPSTEAIEEEDGAWASFKKLVTPKKRIKRSSLSSEDTKIPGSVEEPKPSEGEQISDHSTEESKKRKDSSVSWEAVLCGSGRRRSRKTSDSEDETPQIENDNTKQAAESPLESSNEVDEILASSPKPAGSPSEGDGGSTWKSFKRLIIPKRKGKSEEEIKDNIQSDTEVTQDESAFSAEKLLPGRKKRKSDEKQDQESSDEADVASGDDDSETPAVVPLSEFDTVETDVVIQTQADVESHVPKEADYELQQDVLDQRAEPALHSENLLTEGQKVQDNDDALQNQAPTTSATDEDKDDDLAELISKHQQLSDIPEEGIITETNGTPASVTEDAAIDDTIAEDLIEITSEVFTAPEPVDITLADETEMISAVSQLSESSKTSGNTTPVPPEYDIKETEVLLQQVVETITTTSKAVPVYSDELSSEKVVGSVTHQILESFVPEDQKLLEIHRRSDANAIITGLNVEEMDPVNVFAAKSQTESISEVNEALSTETVSEIATEEFDTADMAVDEVHEVNVSKSEDSVAEFESINESQHLEECPTEVNEAVSAELMHDSKEISKDEASVDGIHQTETEPPKMDSEEVNSAATEAEEIQDGVVDQEEQLETKDENVQGITDQVEVKDDSAVVVEDLHETTAIKADTLDLEEGSDQTLEKEATSEDITAVETVIDEAKEETVPLTEVNVESENEDELPVDLSKAEHKEPEVLEAVDASKLDSDDGLVQSLKTEEKSEEMPADGAVTEEPKEATEANVESEEVPMKAAETDHVQEPELLPCDVKDIVTETETEAEAPMTDQEVTESVEEGSAHEPEKLKSLEEEISKPELEAEALTSEQETIESVEEVSAQEPEKQKLIEEEIPKPEPEAEILTSEQETIESVEEVSAQEPDKQKVLEEEISKPEPEAEALTSEQETIESVEEGSSQKPEKQTLLEEDIPKPEPEAEAPASKQQTIESVEEGSSQEPDEQKLLEEEIPKPELEEEALTSKQETTESVEEVSSQEPEEQRSLEEEIPKPEPEAEALTSDQETIESVEEGSAQEPEKPKSLEEEIAKPEPEAEAVRSEQETIESVEEGSSQELEKQRSLEEEIAKPETEDVIASEEIPSEVVAQLNQSLEVNQDQTTQNITDDIPQDVHVEEEDHTPEVVDELTTLTAVHVSSVNEEASSVQVLEKTVNSEEPPAPCVDIPAVTEEPKHEVHISEVQDSIEGEKEGGLPGAEVKTAAVEHAKVAQVSTCNSKDISAAIPDVMIEKRSDIDEPLIDTVINELQLKETIETTTPLMKDDAAETAQEGNVVVMMHLPLVEFEDNHRIQVQVVDVNIKAEANVDTTLELGVMEDKEVLHDCHETVKKVDNLSAISEIEEQLISEESKVSIQEVVQHMKENLPECMVVQSTVQNEVVNVEQEIIKQPNAAIVESVLNEGDDLKVMEESTGSSSERPDEKLVITEDSVITTEHQASEDVKQTPDKPESSDVPLEACKEDLEETNAELQKSEVSVTAEDATCSSEELTMKKVNEDTMEVPQIAQTQIATPSNTGLVVPQNTGVISSTGNVEPPSTLSLEFKLNIQFGQTKLPVTPPHTTERAEPVKQTDVSEVGVQAVEEVEPKRQINPVETQKQTELTEVAAQETETTGKEASLDSAETAVITSPPVPLDLGIQEMEKVEPVEETISTERVIPNIQATETIQPVSKTEEREMFLSQQVLSEACDQEAKVEEPVKQTDEECDQDVWLDAEEDIEAKEEKKVSLPEEPMECKTDGDQEEEALLEQEVEVAPTSNTEAEENQQENHKKEGTCGTSEVDSEGEDFAVALESPETATKSITTVEWD